MIPLLHLEYILLFVSCHFALLLSSSPLCIFGFDIWRCLPCQLLGKCIHILIQVPKHHLYLMYCTADVYCLLLCFIKHFSVFLPHLVLTLTANWTTNADTARSIPALLYTLCVFSFYVQQACKLDIMSTLQ